MRSIHPLLLPAMFALGNPVIIRNEPAPYFGHDGYRAPRKKIGRSKYMPHQGERECARRRKQIAKAESLS